MPLMLIVNCYICILEKEKKKSATFLQIYFKVFRRAFIGSLIILVPHAYINPLSLSTRCSWSNVALSFCFYDEKSLDNLLYVANNLLVFL